MDYQHNGWGQDWRDLIAGVQGYQQFRGEFQCGGSDRGRMGPSLNP